MSAPTGPEFSDDPPPAPPFGPLVRNLSMWRMCLMQFCVNVGWVFLVSWLPKYLKSVHNVDEKTGGLMSTLVLLAGICGVILGGPLADWLNKRFGVRRSRVIQLVGAKAVAAIAFLACIFLDSAWAIVGALAVVAFMTDMGIPAVWAYMMDVGGRNAAAVFGWGNMWGNLCAAISPLIYNVVRGQHPALADWNNMMLVCLLAFVVAGICALGIDATQPIVTDEPRPTVEPTTESQ